MKKMRKNNVFEHFLLCKLRKESQNRRILRKITAKFHKSDRLLGVCRALPNSMQKIVQKHDFYYSNSVRSPKIGDF